MGDLKPRRRWLRVLVIGAAVILLLVFLAPMVAGWFAPGIVGGAISKSINGQAKVDSVKLSWFGGQRIGPVTITDAGGKQVASVNITASRGLLGLARGGMSMGDLGTVTISGSASLTRGPDGTLNVSKLAKASNTPATPRSGSGSSGGSVPPGLKAAVVVDKFAIDYTDESGSGVYRVAVPALSGRGAIAGGSGDLSLDGAVQYQRTAQDKPAPGGTIAVKAHADGFADASGKLTPQAAKIDADIQAKDLSVAAADALAGMDNRLVAGIGETLQASITAKGTVSDAAVTVAATSRAVNVDLALKTDNGVLTTTKPGRIAIAGGGLMPLIPGLSEGLEKSGMKLDRLPDTSVSVDNLRLPLPVKGGPPDFRGASVALGIQTTETVGTISVPQADGTKGAPQALKIAPLKASVTSLDLARDIAITASSSATIGGQSAGVLAVDMKAIEPLAKTGMPGMPARIEGAAKLTGVATALAQPLVDKTGVVLAQDVGPTLDFQLSAATTGAAPAPTRLTLDVKSANLNAAAKADIEGKWITLPGEGVKVQVGSAGPLVGRMLKDKGVVLQSGLPVTVTAQNVSMDLDAYGKNGDLRAIKGLVKLETGAATGRLTLPEQPEKALELTTLVAIVDARDIAKGVSIEAGTSAKVDGQQAGVLAAKITASSLLKPDGSPTGQFPAINGLVQLNGVSTHVVQPFVASQGLDLPKGIGDKLAVDIKLAAAGGGTTIPATDADIRISSPGLNGALALTLDGRTIKTRGDDGAVSLRSPAALAGKAARDAGIILTDGGYAKLSIKSLLLAMDEHWSPRLDQTGADVEFNVGGFAVSTAPDEAGPAPSAVGLGQVIAGAKLAPGATPTLSLRGSGKQGAAEFFMQGGFELPGLIGKNASGKAALTPKAVRPLGTLDVNNLPTSLVGLAFPSRPPAKPGDKPGADMARLARDAIGPTATVKLAATQGATPDSRALSLSVKAAQLNGIAEGSIDDKALAINKLDFRDQVSPELATTVIRMIGGGLASQPRLVSPATITISATPITLPLAGAKPDLSKAGDATIKMGIEGKVLVENVVIRGAEGQRDLGTLGVENVMLTAAIPVASLAAGGPTKPANVQLTAGVLGDANKRIVDLKGGAKVNLADGKPQGDLNADVALNILDAAWVDSFLGKPGMLEGGVGKTAKVDATAVVKFPTNGSPAGSEAPAFDRALITASITAPRLTTQQPLKATALPTQFGVDSPMIVKWSMDPAWANRYVLAPENPNGKSVAQFAAPMDVTATLTKLTLCTDPKAGPLQPGIFAADISLDSPGSTLTTGKQATPIPLKNIRARVMNGKDPGSLGFSVSIQEAGAQAGGAGAAGAAVNFAGGIYSLADSTGKLTTDRAQITMNGSAKSIPTVLIDAIAHQGGLLTEALGPTATVDVKTEGLSRQGGNLTCTLASQRADTKLNGSIQGGAFVIQQPPGGKPVTIATLKEATPELGKMLVKGLPAIGSFEKRKEDAPATLSAYNLKLPVDGDLRKLNGRLVVDLGAAQFNTSGAFSAILKATGQKQTGQIGQRLPPFEMNFKDGVGSYEKILLPLGEFRLGTSGSFDLVNKQLDVVTYIPFGALTDEVAGKLNTGLGTFLSGIVPKIEEATMVPFRTRGSFDNHKTEPDLEAFGKNLIDTIRPDNLIKDLLKEKEKK